MSFPPFDSSAPSHAPSPRNAYPQPAYGSYDQPGYGHMGYGDMPQSDQRYPSQVPLQYASEAAGAPSGSGQYDSYGGPSFSPTSAQFAADAYGTLPNSDAMTYAPRRRHQSASAVNLPSESRYPTSRRSSGEGHMPAVQEGYEFVPSQVPSQPYYDPNAPSSRHAAVRPSTGSSSTASALALEKPYVCDICQTRFARHHDCRRHRETHVVNASGEKPHHCVVCGKSFTRKDALKRHTNQKGCDINAAVANNNLSSRSSRSSSSSSPQQVAGTFYPVGNLPHGSASYY